MMKKTAIALGIAALACGAQAAEVFKNADTAVEVNAELYFYNLNIVDTANAMARNYFQGAGSQLQIKSSKMIDADLTVFGQFELDGDPVGDNATFVTDDMKFGVKSKSMGTIQVGQFDTYMEDELMEIAGSFIITGNAVGLVSEAAAGNDGRHLLYSHKIGDFAFGLDFTTSQNAAVATDTQNGFAYTASYTLGGLKLVAGASTIARYKSDTFAANSNKEAKGFGASYVLTSGLGQTRFAALSATNTSYSTTAAYDGLETTYNTASVSHTFGQWNVGVISNALSVPALSASAAAYTANENGVQVVYDLGKGAKLYAASSNQGLTTSKGNFTEVGFTMAF